MGAFVAASIALTVAGPAAAYAAPHAAPHAGTSGPHPANGQSMKVHGSNGQGAPGHSERNASKKQATEAVPPTPAAAAAPAPTASLLAETSLPPSSQPAPGVTAFRPPLRTVASPAVPAGAPDASVIRDEPMILSSGGWQGVSLQAAVDLRVPILFGAAVLLFVLLQALVDRRDPKVSRAPERGDDDTVGFS